MELTVKLELEFYSPPKAQREREKRGGYREKLNLKSEISDLRFKPLSAFSAHISRAFGGKSLSRYSQAAETSIKFSLRDFLARLFVRFFLTQEFSELRVPGRNDYGDSSRSLRHARQTNDWLRLVRGDVTELFDSSSFESAHV